MRNPFTTHPRENGMGYWYHLGYALVLGVSLMTLGLVAVVHAVLPFLFTTTVSGYIARLDVFLSSRKHKETSDGRTTEDDEWIY